MSTLKTRTLFFALALNAVQITACVQKAPSTPAIAALPPAVRTAKIERDDTPRPVKGLGLLASKSERRLSFMVGGVIAEVRAEEGQTVKKGQQLAAISMPGIDAQVSAARTGYQKSVRDFDRVTKLHASRVLTDEQLENATTARDVAQAQLAAVEFSRTHAVIVAPSAGRISRKLAEQGEMVQPGAPVLVLASSDGGWVVRVALPDREVVRVAIGDRAAVRFEALGNTPLAAKVAEIASSAMAQTGLFEVELALAAAPPALLTGLVGKVEIEPSGRAPVTWVPIEALIEAEGNDASVFAIEDQRAVKLAVVTDRIEGDRVAVLKGLEGRDRVVTAGRVNARHGALLRVEDERVEDER